MFRKVNHVSLVNESEPDEEDLEAQNESDRSTLLVGEDETGDNPMGAQEEEMGSISGASATGFQKRPNWKFWKREKRYELKHAPSAVQTGDAPGKKVTLCGRTFHLCRINSWRAIFLVLLVFSVSITLAVIISKLAKEPPVEQLRQGQKVMGHQ